MNRLLDKVYNSVNSPAYLAGQQAVLREAKKKNDKVTLVDVKRFLATQDSYTLHKPVKRRFGRNRVFAAGISSDWQIDLIDFRNLPCRKHKYVLACIDVFSKKAWLVPMLTKRPADTLEAFKTILKEGAKPRRVCSDKGKEFAGVFKTFMDDQDITYFHATSPDVKASVVERFIKTAKGRLWRHFTKNKTLNWIDALPIVAAAYNASHHRSIGMAPNDVDLGNENLVRSRLYNTPMPPKVPFKFKVGNPVRITKEKGKLSKGYRPNFTKEIFKVRERLNRWPATYRLQDQDGEHIDGVFYEPELVLATHKPPPRRMHKSRRPV